MSKLLDSITINPMIQNLHFIEDSTIIQSIDHSYDKQLIKLYYIINKILTDKQTYFFFLVSGLSVIWFKVSASLSK
ncbi:hypothetical protein EZJ43_05200 [Pedobacter changchengzhani]|uniref:Uncharacterized protein n=1 Tax=Pedobacter changchengzhani TaxID=2529274 RepID=A0A4V3A090_9SPHI|nr:hypothetical protein [Pedobacter changchengzhani]TDG36683.1 hypothetical protein EZJ43_05200 [Pedobacter changchengzhani]